MQTSGRNSPAFGKSASFGLIFNDQAPKSNHLRWISSGAPVLWSATARFFSRYSGA